MSAFWSDPQFWTITLAGAVRLATPIALTALGETVAERAGLLNLGADAVMTAGALVAVIAASSFGWPAGMTAGAAAGLAFGAAYASLALAFGVNQIVVGVALSLIGYGFADYAFQLWQPSGQIAPFVAVAPTWRVPALADFPVFGAALFSQSLLTYAAAAAFALVALVLSTTRFGLALRAAGQDAEAARLRGVRVGPVRALAALFAGTMAGLGGAAISMGFLGAYVDGVSAGRGYIAIAVVMVGRWSLGGALAGALLFGGLESASLRSQAYFAGVPAEVFSLAPYLLTLATLALSAQRSRAPRELGR